MYLTLFPLNLILGLWAVNPSLVQFPVAADLSCREFRVLLYQNFYR